MSSINLKPVDSAASPAIKHPAPTTSAAPHGWKFRYTASPDGHEENLLIMLHGMGDTCESFFKLGTSLNLPGTCVMSLQGQEGIPLMMDTPAFSWYPTFSPQFPFLPLPAPDPSAPTPKLRAFLVDYLCGDTLGWSLDRIHLFGWGQGGSMALEVAVDLAKRQAGRLGSVVSVCGPLLSTPSVGAPNLAAKTPVLYVHRPPGFTSVSEDPKPPAALQKTFAPFSLRVIRAPFVRQRVSEESGTDQGMLANRQEWNEVMRFWAEHLKRRQDREWMKGSKIGGSEGEVYEVTGGGGAAALQGKQS